jgi:hypothetical protein
MADLESNKNKYLEATHKLNDYNEIYNMNSYMLQANSQELYRLNYTNNLLKTRILKLKQEYMLHEHDTHVYHFRRNILYITALVVAGLLLVFSLFVQGKLAKNVTMGIAVGVTVLYLIVILLIVRRNLRRTTYSYDHYYWNQIKS